MRNVPRERETEYTTTLFDFDRDEVAYFCLPLIGIVNIGHSILFQIKGNCLNNNRFCCIDIGGYRKIKQKALPVDSFPAERKYFSEKIARGHRKTGEKCSIRPLLLTC